MPFDKQSKSRERSERERLVRVMFGYELVGGPPALLLQKFQTIKEPAATARAPPSQRRVYLKILDAKHAGETPALPIPHPPLSFGFQNAAVFRHDEA
jgi:hypothetical protein